MDKDEIRKLNTETGERLKKLRKNFGKKQSDVAKEAGCTTNYISLIETGKCKIPVFIVMAYSRVLGMSPNLLLGYKDNTDEMRYLTESLGENVREYVEKIVSLIEEKPET